MAPALPTLTSLPLIHQSLAVLREQIPDPTPLLGLLDQKAPLPLKQLVLEVPLNRQFARAIKEGEFDDFEGRTLRLEIRDSDLGVTFGFWQGRLRVLDGPGEATIRGSWTAFRELAERRQDPDQLFFQRRLVIEGDTELGLGIKNLLDSLDWRVSLRSG